MKTLPRLRCRAKPRSTFTAPDDGSRGLSLPEYQQQVESRLNELERHYGRCLPRCESGVKLCRPVEARMGGRWIRFGSSTLAGQRLGVSGTYVRDLARQHGSALLGGVRVAFRYGGTR